MPTKPLAASPATLTFARLAPFPLAIALSFGSGACSGGGGGDENEDADTSLVRDVDLGDSDGFDAADSPSDTGDAGDEADADGDAPGDTSDGSDLDIPDTSEVSDVGDASDAADASDTTDSGDTADSSDAADVADLSDAADAADSSDAADAADSSDAADAADTADSVDATDASDTGGTDPRVTGLGGYEVLARGATFRVVGVGLSDATALTVAGVTQEFTVDGGALVFTLAESTPLGAQSLVVTTPSGALAPVSVTVIDLRVVEVDPDSPDVTDAADSSEFVEVRTGLSGVEVDLSGYTVVLFAGTASSSPPLAAGRAYLAVELSASTSGGVLVVGDSRTSPDVDWGLSAVSSHMINGYNAVGVFQGDAARWSVVCPDGIAQIQTCGGNLWTSAPVLDALVYKGRLADENRGTFVGMVPGDAVLVEGDTSGDREAVSIQWCPVSGWGLGAPSPGVANRCD